MKICMLISEICCAHSVYTSYGCIACCYGLTCHCRDNPCCNILDNLGTFRSCCIKIHCFIYTHILFVQLSIFDGELVLTFASVNDSQLAYHFSQDFDQCIKCDFATSG